MTSNEITNVTDNQSMTCEAAVVDVKHAPEDVLASNEPHDDGIQAVPSTNIEVKDLNSNECISEEQNDSTNSCHASVANACLSSLQVTIKDQNDSLLQCDDADSGYNNSREVSQRALTGSDLSLSEKDSPNSSKVTGPDLDSPASTNEPPSMPSDKSDSHGTSEGRYPEMCSVLEFEDDASCSHLDSDRKVASYLGEDNNKQHPESHDCKNEESPLEDTESMSKLDGTIDSVLEKIRAGREMEVEFNPILRQQVLPPAKSSPSATEKLTVFTSEDAYLSQSKSSKVSNTPPREESSAYLAQRQRMQTALNQATSFYGLNQQQEHSHIIPTNERSYFKHNRTPFHQQTYSSNVSPHLPPSGLRLQRSQSLYSPSSYQYGNCSPGYNFSGQKHYPQRYQHMNSPYANSYSHYPNSAPISPISPYYSQYIQSSNPNVHQYTHSPSFHSPIPPNMQNYSQSTSSPTPNMANSIRKSSDINHMGSSRNVHSNGQFYASITPEQISPRSDSIHQSRNINPSSLSGLMSPGCMNNDSHSPQLHFEKKDMSHFPFNQVNENNSAIHCKSQIMPPPSNSIPVPGKKRKKLHNQIVTDAKRRKSSKTNSRDIYEQQIYANEIFYQSAVKKLSLNNYSELLQDPLVVPSLSLLPPKGGLNLGNIVDGFEAEECSPVFQNLPQKYELNPFIPKLSKPKIYDHHIEQYIVENFSNVKLPFYPIINIEKGSNSETFLENPVCKSPEPADCKSSLLCHLSCENDFSSDRGTPPLANDIDSEKLVQHWNTMNSDPTSRLAKKQTLMPNEKMKYFVQNINCPITIANAQGKIITALVLSDENVSAASSIIKQIMESSSEVKNSRGRPPLSSIRDRRFPEEGLTISTLVSSEKRACCDYCQMAIIGTKVIRSNKEISEDSEKMFCSVNCFSKHTRLSASNLFIRQQSDSSVLSGSSKNLLKRLTINRLIKKKNSCETAVSLTKPHFKRWRGIRYKQCGTESGPLKFYKEESNMKAKHILARYSQQILAPSSVNDSRICILCKSKGDARERVASRLLNLNIDKWIHLNCALWCFDVYETVCGALVEVEPSATRALKTMCVYCGQYGAGIICYRSRCPAVYHVPCAHAAKCMFFTDRGMYCPAHKIRDHPLHLSKLTAKRRVYINRDESEQVAKVVLDEGSGSNTSVILRIGSLILHQIGQLLPEQITSGDFNTVNCIYPVGFHTSRFYWSSRILKTRCLYHCYIKESGGLPRFVVSVEEEDYPVESYESSSCFGAWETFLLRIAELRRSNGLVKLFPEHIRGEDLFGLNEPHIVRVIESLPGVDSLKHYAFKFGRLQLITEMPLAINPTGCVRSEPKLRTYVRRRAPHSVVTRTLSSSVSSSNLSNSSSPVVNFGEPFSGYSRLLITGKTQQYRKLKTEWKNNVIFGRSRIQGLGLFAARDLDKYTLIIEYLGELIRNEVANRRELMYEAQNRGVYMFRVDEHLIVDATMCGGLARYVNHSCEPNCSAEILNFDGSSHIVILAKRKIEKGEELTYDYNFDFEDCIDKIPCLCGAPTCRKWMN